MGRGIDRHAGGMGTLESRPEQRERGKGRAASPPRRVLEVVLRAGGAVDAAAVPAVVPPVDQVEGGVAGDRRAGPSEGQGQWWRKEDGWWHAVSLDRRAAAGWLGHQKRKCENGDF